ncbi:MAG: type I-E CRISPR-associated protein Cse2/CasB [Herpetosiphonaceae bacterium]|nr:type I-E CRISPR-associated protein Cse2/CasB [Herpetosiphonaceae bacterium]
MTEIDTQGVGWQGRDAEFIHYLHSLVERDDRTTLAALRRGLGKEPGTASEMYPHVVPFLPGGKGLRDEMPYYLVAALFGWHQKDWSSDGQRPNLGGSLAQLRRQQANERGTEPEQGDSTERRFVAVLSSTFDDLPYHLRQMIGLLRTKEVPVNWRQLLSDLKHWEDDDRYVQRDWARSFWKQRPPEQPADQGQEPSIPTDGSEPSDDESFTA